MPRLFRWARIVTAALSGCTGYASSEARSVDFDPSLAARPTEILPTFRWILPRPGTPPAGASCHEVLDFLGLDWSIAGAREGVEDPVTVGPEIAGVSYRYAESAVPRPLFMDCDLAPRLVELSMLVREYDISEIVHYGIYNYRCIGGGDPSTGCRPSQHAFAHAIDLFEFVTDRGGVMSVEDDWVIGPRETMCVGPYAGLADRVLHEIACRLFEERVFEIVLTPNYNAAHRNHIHADMTDGSHFLGETVGGLDPIAPGLGD